MRRVALVHASRAVGVVAPMIRTADQPRLAYLASQYPAPSHTFIRREIAGLRRHGWVIDTLSIRPGMSSDPSDRAPVEATGTFCVLQQSLVAFAAAHLVWVTRHPLAYLRTMRLAASHRAPGVRALLLAIAHFLEAGLLARELQRRQIDHLHNHFANSAATVGMLAAKLAGITWSFTMHGVSETDYPAGLLLGRKIERAEAVMCASWFMRAQGLRTVGPEQWDKLSVIRCGVELDEMPQMKNDATKAVRSLLCVGRLSPEKGHVGLFHAYKILLTSNPKLELRLVGDGPSRDLLEQLAAELGIDDRVRFLGAQSEASTLAEIGKADLLVLPSLLEGLPVVLMEAMALGVPVVAPRVAGIPELVGDGRNGLLFTPSNWTDLADHMSQLISDSQLRQQFARNARETIVSEYSIEASSAELVKVFASLGNGHRRQAAEPFRLSFGLREAILFSILAILIAAAAAFSRGHSAASGPQPFPRGAAPSQR